MAATDGSLSVRTKCSATPESARLKNSQASTAKRNPCREVPRREFISDIASAFNEKDANHLSQQCKDIRSMLWLPQKTDLPVPASLSNGSSNYQVEGSNYWIKLVPEKFDTAELIGLLPHSAIATAKEVPKPKRHRRKNAFYGRWRAYFDLLSLFERTYNLAVERYANDEHKDDEGNWRNHKA